jgi:hypothetical protein
VSIDTELQFKVIDAAEFAEVSEHFNHVLKFHSAIEAYHYAWVTEDEGFGVAFAKFEDSYYVWSE